MFDRPRFSVDNWWTEPRRNAAKSGTEPVWAGPSFAPFAGRSPAHRVNLRLLAMQKVEGSSPFSRFEEPLQIDAAPHSPTAAPEGLAQVPPRGHRPHRVLADARRPPPAAIRDAPYLPGRTPPLPAARPRTPREDVARPYETACACPRHFPARRGVWESRLAHWPARSLQSQLERHPRAPRQTCGSSEGPAMPTSCTLP